MGQIQFQTEDASKAAIKNLKTTEVGRVVALLKRDSPLSEIEREAEENAFHLSRYKYPSIAPVRGTLGYMFRRITPENILNRNESIIRILEQEVRTETTENIWIRQLLRIWDKCDDSSRKRVDFFDILARDMKIPIKKVYLAVQSSLWDYTDAMLQMDLSEAREEVFQQIRTFSAKEKNIKDRELLAKASKLVTDKPLVNIEDNSTTNNLSIGGSSFLDRLSKYEELEEGSNIERKLIEGEVREDIIEGDFEDVSTE
jgi:hypothetical protein